MAEALSKDAILAALRQVIDPATRRDVVSLGFVRNVAYCDGVARIAYQLPHLATGEGAPQALQQITQATLMRLPGMKSVNVDISAAPAGAANPLPGVEHVIAVGAGKGGVGKSTIAVLTAIGLKRRGMRVGLLDADVYGPSIPKLTGTEDRHPESDASGRVIPPEIDGIRILSMGYLVDPDQAVVWRGPMAQKYVKELLERGLWGELDFLIVDLPPGTGDIPLTLAQSIPLTGAVVACTPQDVALLDAVKAVRMYQKLGVDTLGVVENMSYYLCPQCGHRDEIFSHGGAAQAAVDLGVPFLGGIPLNIAIRRFGDAGTPAACFTQTEGYVSAAIDGFITRLLEEISDRDKLRAPAPTLNIRG